MEVNDLAEPLTSFLSAAQASRLTPAAAELTKEGMLAAMHSYAAGGTLVGSLEKGDILSVRDAFAERQSAVGVTAGGGGSCCCCCAASDTPLGISVGALRLGSVSDVSRAVAMISVDSDGQGGGSTGVRVEADPTDLDLLAVEVPPSGHRAWLDVEVPGL